MVRRRWAAAVGLAACLLLLHLVVPGLAPGGRTAEAAVAAPVDTAGPVGPVGPVRPVGWVGREPARAAPRFVPNRPRLAGAAARTLEGAGRLRGH